MSPTGLLPKKQITRHQLHACGKSQYYGNQILYISSATILISIVVVFGGVVITHVRLDLALNVPRPIAVSYFWIEQSSFGTFSCSLHSVIADVEQAAVVSVRQ